MRKAIKNMEKDFRMLTFKKFQWLLQLFDKYYPKNQRLPDSFYYVNDGSVQVRWGSRRGKSALYAFFFAPHYADIEIYRDDHSEEILNGDVIYLEEKLDMSDPHSWKIFTNWVKNPEEYLSQ